MVAFRLWLSGFQPVSREGGCGLGAPRGRALSYERRAALSACGQLDSAKPSGETRREKKHGHHHPPRDREVSEVRLS